MYFVSITRLRLRNLINLPAFIIANEASIRSIKNINGFISGKELVDKKLTFWTVTVWESDKAMKYFRNDEPHKKAMRKLSDWCDEGAYAHWLQEEAIIPAWDVLHKKLMTEGKITKLKKPSAQHVAFNHPAPVWRKIERQFKFK
jgi:hypothetical protein